MLRCVTRIPRVLLAAVIFGLLVAPSNAAEPNKEVRVLFIGNSFTYYNDLPNMLAELAEAGGQPALALRERDARWLYARTTLEGSQRR